MPAAAPTPASPAQSLTDLKHMKVAELARIAHALEIEAAGAMKKQDLIFAILQAQSKVAEEKREEMEVAGEGTLEVLRGQPAQLVLRQVQRGQDRRALRRIGAGHHSTG